jgi:5'-methylthioadenosine nucleosidase
MKIGTVAAAVNSYIAIQLIRPDILINAGTAGGFRRKGCEIGDVFITTDIRFHDRRIPIPAFHEYSRGHFRSHLTPNLISVYHHSPLSDDLLIVVPMQTSST